MEAAPKKKVLEMDSADSILLNRFFTRNTFRQIIEDGESPAYADAVHKIIASPEGRTNRECVCELYQKLKNSYQNEYFYKNTLLNKLLLGVHQDYDTRLPLSPIKWG